VRRHIGQDGLIQRYALQEFKPVEQAVHIGRVSANLELAQPDKAGDRAVRAFSQQCIKLAAQFIIQPVGNPGFGPSLGSDKCIRGKTFDNRDPR